MWLRSTSLCMSSTRLYWEADPMVIESNEQVAMLRESILYNAEVSMEILKKRADDLSAMQFSCPTIVKSFFTINTSKSFCIFSLVISIISFLFGRTIKPEKTTKVQRKGQ